MNGTKVEKPKELHELTKADRIRVFMEDDKALAELAQVVHQRAMGNSGNRGAANTAGHLEIKIRERRAAMWGYDSPQSFDMVMVSETKRPSSLEALTAAIDHMCREGQISQESQERIRAAGGYLPKPEPTSNDTSDPGDQQK